MRHSIEAAIVAGLMAGAAVAQPAASRSWDVAEFWHGAPGDLGHRMEIAQDRVARWSADGSLDRREVEKLNQELYDVRSRARDLRASNRGMLTPDQRDRLFARLDDVVREMHAMRRDRR